MKGIEETKGMKGMDTVKAWKAVGGIGGTLSWMAFADIGVSLLLGGAPWLFGWRCLFGGLVGMFAAVGGLARNGGAVVEK